jgi:superfamily I DNA/RNA helicase
VTTATTPGFSPSLRQLDAIEAPLGPLLVLAGPGAGKTFCLIERIRYLIEQENFDPARICAVTFTNKAAQEIAERLGKTLGERAHEVKGGTLHALCAEILRAHGYMIGAKRGFGIADEDYQKDVLRRLGVYPEKRRGWVLTRFGLHRARGVPLVPEDLERFNQYRGWLERHNLLDFDELVLKTAELFAAYPEIAAEVAARWDYVLVDEFQDLNPKQYTVVRALTQRHRNVFVVGDDEQSVYSWTGADPQVLLQFKKDFGVPEIVLDENRRNASQIFAAARLLMQRNPQLFDAKVLTANHQSEFAIGVHGFADEHAEARWLLADLLDDKRRHGLDWSDYGVLYRKHEIGDGLEGALLRAGIPCRLASGRALRDNPVVRYLIAALRVMADPADALRQEAFIRVVLPPNQWSGIVSEAERRKLEPLVWMRKLARWRDLDEEERKKLRRAESTLQNLPALAQKHQTLSGLVEELLSQRVGTYRTVLEDLHEELSDPAADPAIVALAERLGAAQHGRRRVWLPRLGGLELALSGLLLKAGVTSVAYLDDGALPADGEVVLSKADGGSSGLALGVFKALQLVRAGALPDAFQSFVAVDIETTDFTASCEIVELGAVRVSGGAIIAEYGQLVKPQVPIAESARRVHGITDEDVREMPTLAAAWSAFRSFCGDDIWVAHNGNGLDFPVLRRLGAELPEGAEFVSYDSLPLARALHSGSCKLGELAHAFGIEVGQAHRARDDARTLALVFLELQKRKLARARKTALAHLLDYLGVALALTDPGQLTEEGRLLFKVSRAYALGRYSDCLEHYRLERASPRAFDAPSLEQVIQKLGGRRKLEELRREKSAAQRYPEAMTRLRRLLEGLPGEAVADQLREFLTRVALSRSDTAEQDAELPFRVNLLTLHSTKGLEFSRVYIVGAEDAQLPGVPRDGREPPDDELQEARRLLYVGMTRAKDRLVLTRAERRSELPTGGYRFLTEMGLVPETQP